MRKHADCVTCGKHRPIPARGLCGVCYRNVLIAEGRMKAPERKPEPKPVLFCLDCKEAKNHTRGRCAKCHQRWRRANGLRPQGEGRMVTCLRCARTRRHHAHGVCRGCSSSWRRDNVEGAMAADARRSRRNFRQKKFGLTWDGFEAMLQAQAHTCAVCDQKHSDEPYASLQVDHCHTTGRIRGLLCRRCNTGLGYYEKHATGFAEYLRKYG